MKKPEDKDSPKSADADFRIVEGRVHWRFESPRGFGKKVTGGAATALALLALFRAEPAAAQSTPTPSTLVSVCSGVSLPPSVVTGIMDPVVTGIYGPIETNVNQTLGALGLLVGLPSPLNVNVNGLLATAAAGSDINLSVLSANGTLVGPSSQCDAAADSFTLDTPAGVSIGGNQITGLGATGEQAVAGEIDSIAIGNNAATNASAVGAIALGTDATVGTGATGSVALGAGSSATAANSVALGAGSIASLPNSVSVGAPGAERVVANVANGVAPTDAVNMSQLTTVAAGIPANPVEYDDSTHATVTLDGAGGTRVTNVAAGAVTATSTDAVNGSQLHAVQTQVDGIQTQVTNNTNAITTLQGQTNTNTTNIANLQTQTNLNTTNISNLQTQVTTISTDIVNLGAEIDATTTAVTNLSVAVTNGAIGPVQYSNAATPNVPNGGTPTNDVALVGAATGPVGLHNVANGVIAAGSTDAVNGGQIASLALGVQNAVTYDSSTHTSVTLNQGGPATVVQNLANGVAANDAVNVGQLGSAMNNAVSIANAYTDSRLEALDFDLSKARRDARAGTAAALAAAGMPQASGEGRTMIAGAVGAYRGRVGLALGASYRAENGRSIYKLGVTYDSSRRVGATAGAGIEF